MVGAIGNPARIVLPSAAKLIIQTAYTSNGLMLCGFAVGERVP